MNRMQISPGVKDGVKDGVGDAQELAEACSRVIAQRDQAAQALGNQGVLR
ncbi:MAG: hypothetical protein V7629_14250 [Motiliproteus sp.]